ncbi:angiogenin-like [Fundulus heteroclitus]|uniref:angiogenin-like n=1 Tax=Fundulus heteroclitus TaxID=8078 RepID=UPI00165C1CBA|nr:angiogenin-like [Fundulus heteroclitus]
MKIPLACVLLLSTTAFCQDQVVTARYRQFINQHVNAGMSQTRCDAVITQRHITETDSNRCKETNTFIRATTNHIKPICDRAGEPYGNLMKSLQPFDVVICTLKNKDARRPHCQYKGVSRTRRIAISCMQGFPVHFDRVFDD